MGTASSPEQEGAAEASPTLATRLGAGLLMVLGVFCSLALVVVLFGGPALPQDRSIDSLLGALEAASGDKSVGLLLSREKELLQFAFELSVRLEAKDAQRWHRDESGAPRLGAVARRVAAIVDADLNSLSRMGDEVPMGATMSDGDRASRSAIRARRLELLIHALGQTGRIEAIDPLIGFVQGDRERYVSVAIRQLGNLHTLPGIRRAVEPIAAALEGAARDETRMVACTALSVLATSHDRRVLEVLRMTRLSGDGEVAWSAALALARLGSPSGKSTLLDLLDRAFLEGEGRYETRDETGKVLRYKLQAERVDAILIAAIDAAAKLDEVDIRGRIKRLATDPSPAVRREAAQTLEEWRIANSE